MYLEGAFMVKNFVVLLLCGLAVHFEKSAPLKFTRKLKRDAQVHTFTLTVMLEY